VQTANDFHLYFKLQA